MSRLFILLPVYNRRKITENFVRSLQKQTFQNFHLVLIDDGSTDGTYESILEMVTSERLTILKGKGNWWWAGSLQKAYIWFQSRSINEEDFILIINDDTSFDADFLNIGVNLLESNENTLILAECFDEKTQKLIDKGCFVDWRSLNIRQPNDDEEINCFSTRGLFFRVKDFFRIGGFYPKLLPHYLSDYEFTIRAKRRGYKLLTNERLKLYSDENSTGHRSQKEKNLFVFLKTIFLKRNTYNPIYWTTFIILACPFKYKMKHIVRIVYGFVKNFLYHLKISFK